MNTGGAEKKWREAEYFLGKLSERSQQAFGEQEELDYLLSAFLGATRSVDYRLRHQNKGDFKAFYAAWEAGLSAQDRALIKFMVDDRNLEVHEGGSGRAEAA